MRNVGHVVDTVHKAHQLTLDGAKGTQTLYLKDVDENTGIEEKEFYFKATY
jgi:hypothetical protein